MTTAQSISLRDARNAWESAADLVDRIKRTGNHKAEDAARVKLASARDAYHAALAANRKDAAPVDPAPAAVERPQAPFIATHIDISDQPAPPAQDNCPEWARRRQWSYTVTRKTAEGSEVIKTGTMISDRDYNTVTFYLAFAWNVRTWHHGGHKQDQDGLITAVRMWGRQNKAIITVIAELMPEKPAAVDTGRAHGPNQDEIMTDPALTLIDRAVHALRLATGRDYFAQAHEPNKRRPHTTYTLFERVNGHVFACMPPHRINDTLAIIRDMTPEPTPAAIIAAAAQAAQAAGRELTTRDACALFDQRAACLADGELHDACNWAEIDMADIDEWPAASRARLIADYRAAVA